MLCICLVSVRIREMYTIRFVGGPVVTIYIRAVVVKAAEFNVLLVAISNQVGDLLNKQRTFMISSSRLISS